MPEQDDPTTTDPAARVVALFALVYRRYAAESVAASALHDLTPMQAKALLAVEAPVPMRRVAEVVQAEPSNVTPIIDRLEDRGLVRRQPAPGDRRIKLVGATDAGRAVAASLRAAMPFASAPLAVLTTEQISTLGDLLQLLLDAETPS